MDAPAFVAHPVRQYIPLRLTQFCVFVKFFTLWQFGLARWCWQLAHMSESEREEARYAVAAVRREFPKKST